MSEGITSVIYHLIPDGSNTIVRLTLESEFIVNTEGAAKAAEEGVIQVVARLTGQPIEAIREELWQGKWLSDAYERPEEQSST